MFQPLEQLFGTLCSGCGFGELSLLNLNDDLIHFYSTIAVANTFCVSLSKKAMQGIVEDHDRRLMNDRRDFMIEIEEFKDMSRAVLNKLIDKFEPITCNKGSKICEEDKPFDYIYFIREGEFEMSKTIKMGVNLTQESAHQIMELARENPEPGKITKHIKTQAQKKPGTNTKVHIFGILLKGSYIGLLELSHLKSETYYTTLICKSQSGGSLFRIKKAVFLDKMKNAETVMFRIKHKCEYLSKKLKKEILKMKRSNVEIEESLKTDLDQSSKDRTTKPNILERNANILRHFEEDMLSKGVIETGNRNKTNQKMKNTFVPIFLKQRVNDDQMHLV